MFAVKKLLIFIALFIGKQAYANGSAQFNCNQTPSDLLILNPFNITIDGFKKSGSDKIAKYENESADVTWLESGKIKLEQSCYIKNVKLLISSPGSKIDRDWHLMSYSEEFHPFEFVRVVYTDAETISKRGITEEVVPAFVALMIRENIERQKTFYYARQVGNTVAMAAAVFAAPVTGGGSLAAWATVTYGVVSAVDAYVIYEKRNSYDPSNEQFYKNWDQFKTLADIGAIGITAGAGLYNVAGQVQLLGPKVFVVQTLKAWSNTIKAGKAKIVNIVEQTKKLPKQIVQAFKGYYGGGKNWRTAEAMRDDVMSWAKTYQSKLPTPTQLDKFSKATAASYKKADGTIETVFGRNGGVLNTQSTFPTISAEKNLGLHKELANKLPLNTKWPNTANCAECDAVNQALHNGAKWEDIQIHTIDIRPNGTMTDVIQCSECENIFKVCM